MIYCDYAASTPMDPQVVDAMLVVMRDVGVFGNPSSSHTYGRDAARLIEKVRQQVASLINANPNEIMLTSGATESINTAIKGVAVRQQTKGRHIVTTQVEHGAVLGTCQYLAKQGFEVTYLKPDRQGFINPTLVEQAIRDDTILVSIIHVNNETGAIQDINRIGGICRAKQIPFHVDAVQAIGKIPIDVANQNIDLLSMSAHKFYGPKGTGVLYVRCAPYVKLTPLLHGGGQEKGLRAGTSATHQIVGLGKAAELAQQYLATEPQRIRQLRDRLWQGIQQAVPAAKLNGDLSTMAPHILNVSLPGVDLAELAKYVAFSQGSACHSESQTASHVLTAMQIPLEQIYQSVRFSLGRFTTAAEIDQLISAIQMS